MVLPASSRLRPSRVNAELHIDLKFLRDVKEKSVDVLVIVDVASGYTLACTLPSK